MNGGIFHLKLLFYLSAARLPSIYFYFCKMRIIHRESTEPYFNIAAEEYLVKKLTSPCFMLWQNTPTVVIGKHQNPLREVNLQFVNQHQIPIIRRISGGGTVYHDLGNINYSFIDMGKADSLVNFAKYSQPVLRLLNKLGIPAELSGKSDLCIHGKKFSGNASHVYKNKVLHHGTLLFNSDLNILNESIKIKNHQITDKAVNSNRSTVTNINDHLAVKINLSAFKNLLTEEIKRMYPSAKETILDKTEEAEIKLLAHEKYTRWEWNFGYSPKYEISSTLVYDDTKIKTNILVVKGFIKEIKFAGPLPKDFIESSQVLIGLQHEYHSIHTKLKNHFSDTICQSFLDLLFQS